MRRLQARMAFGMCPTVEGPGSCLEPLGMPYVPEFGPQELPAVSRQHPRRRQIQGYRTPGKDTSRLTLNATGRPMTSLEASQLGGHIRRMHNGGALERCGSGGDILMWLHTTIVMLIDLQTAFF